MLRNPGERWTQQFNKGPMPDNQPSDEGPAKKYFDLDRKIARDYKKAYSVDEENASLSQEFRKYQKWYTNEKTKDRMTLVAYQVAAGDCWLNNSSDYKASCKGVVEDYLACLNIFKAKYGMM